MNVYEEFRGHYSRGVYGNPNLLSYPEYANYRDRSQSFNELAAYAPVSLSLRGSKTTAISGLLVSCNYFDVLADDFGSGPSLRVGRLPTVGWKRTRRDQRRILAELISEVIQRFSERSSR